MPEIDVHVPFDVRCSMFIFFINPLLPLYSLGQKACKVQHIHIELFSEERVLHCAAEMDLTLGAGSDQQIAVRIMGLSDTLNLKHLAE